MKTKKASPSFWLYWIPSLIVLGGILVLLVPTYKSIMMNISSSAGSIGTDQLDMLALIVVLALGSFLAIKNYQLRVGRLMSFLALFSFSILVISVVAVFGFGFTEGFSKKGGNQRVVTIEEDYLYILEFPGSDFGVIVRSSEQDYSVNAGTSKKSFSVDSYNGKLGYSFIEYRADGRLFVWDRDGDALPDIRTRTYSDGRERIFEDSEINWVPRVRKDSEK
ncbi:MAG: hypothetical protein AAFX93_06105 [Verrucomicrobiota bacterium]